MKWVLALVAAGCQAGSSGSSAPVGSGSSSMACPADQLTTLETRWTRRDCPVADPACRSACETDHDPAACMSLAIALEGDPATAKDSTAFYIHACELGLASGCTNYAAFLWKNNRKNAAASCALAMFEKTCAVGDPFACGMAGRMIVDDAAGVADIARGKARLEEACARTAGFPCRVLALELETGKLGSATVDHDAIEGLLLKACKAGDAAACGIHATVGETFSH
jgi:TPR repeat protein